MLKNGGDISPGVVRKCIKKYCTVSTTQNTTHTTKTQQPTQAAATLPHKTKNLIWQIKLFLQYHFNVTAVFLLHLTHTNLQVIFNTIQLERI